MLFLTVLVVLMAFMCAVRGEFCGIDTHTYLGQYEHMLHNEDSRFDDGKEPLASFIIRTALMIWPDKHSPQIAISVLAICPLIWCCKKMSPIPLMTLFLYFACNIYMFGFNGCRQALAITPLLISFYYLSVKKTFKAVIFFAAAVSIHQSSLFCIFAFLLNKVRLTDMKVLVAMGITFVIGLCMRSVTAFDFLFGNYTVYIANGKGFRETTTIATFFTLLMNVYYLFIYFNTKRTLKNNFWLKLYLLAILANNATFMLQWGSRLYLSLAVSQIILYPLIFAEPRLRKNTVLKLCIMIFVTLNFCRVSFSNGGIKGAKYDMYPYYTFFQKAPY
jgi:hypothetical protein